MSTSLLGVYNWNKYKSAVTSAGGQLLGMIVLIDDGQGVLVVPTTTNPRQP